MSNAVKSRVEQTETEIAVLHVQFNNLDEKVVDLKADVKQLHECLDRRMDETKLMLNTMKDANATAYAELSKKMSNIEKIKWMIMGAAAVLGASGTQAIKMIVGKF
jgi:roadblock/LC7 domain-containing protein